MSTIAPRNALRIDRIEGAGSVVNLKKVEPRYRVDEIGTKAVDEIDLPIGTDAPCAVKDPSGHGRPTPTDVYILSVGETVMPSLAYQRQADRRRATSAMFADMLGIAYRAFRDPHRSSNGHPNKAAIASATIGDEALILDREEAGSLGAADDEQNLHMRAGVNPGVQRASWSYIRRAASIWRSSVSANPIVASSPAQNAI